MLLEFEGVYMNAAVSVNGDSVARHPYGYTSFLAISPGIYTMGRQNEIVVVVNNDAQPNSRWYSGTGIYDMCGCGWGQVFTSSPGASS